MMPPNYNGSGYGPDRQRIDASVIDVMPPPLEVHMRLGCLIRTCSSDRRRRL
jgi:hypothetical protein